MKLLKIPFLSSLIAESNFADVNAQLDGVALQTLDNLLWSNDGYKPVVQFTMGHSGDCIYLKYIVFEDDINAHYTENNSPVFEDTCVEFFIAIGDDSKYYNIEFNRLGTCLMAYSGGKLDIKLLPVEVISQIRSESKILPVDIGFNYGWQLTLVIPVRTFIYHQDIQLENLVFRGNFYKCGDKLNKPHFLSWKNIEIPQPGFHRPDFFGYLCFESPKIEE